MILLLVRGLLQTLIQSSVLFLVPGVSMLMVPRAWSGSSVLGDCSLSFTQLPLSFKFPLVCLELMLKLPLVVKLQLLFVRRQLIMTPNIPLHPRSQMNVFRFIVKFQFNFFVRLVMICENKGTRISVNVALARFIHNDIAIKTKCTILLRPENIIREASSSRRENETTSWTETWNVNLNERPLHLFPLDNRSSSCHRIRFWQRE